MIWKDFDGENWLELQRKRVTNGKGTAYVDSLSDKIVKVRTQERGGNQLKTPEVVLLLFYDILLQARGGEVC